VHNTARPSQKQLSSHYIYCKGLDSSKDTVNKTAQTSTFSSALSSLIRQFHLFDSILIKKDLLS